MHQTSGMTRNMSEHTVLLGIDAVFVIHLGA